MSTKDTNPKDALGIRKAPFSTISAPVLAELGLAMLEGSLKYGRHNYRVAGVRSSVYYDAAMRHLTSWWEGEDLDPESGLPHLIKAMASLAVIRDGFIQGNVNDDRPPPAPAGWLSTLNETAKKLIARFPEPKAPFTAIGSTNQASLGAPGHSPLPDTGLTRASGTAAGTPHTDASAPRSETAAGYTAMRGGWPEDAAQGRDR